MNSTKSFLTQVAQELIQSHKPLASIRVILPSKRAVRFLKQALISELDGPSLSPDIISVTDFVAELSGLQPLRSHQLLLRCYESYKKIVPKEKQDSFEQFLHWAPVMLQDFNDLCAHRVPQEKVFHYLTEVESLKQWAYEENQTPLVKNYIAFWQQLPALFSHFTTRLLEEKAGFLGLLFSEAVENLPLYLAHTDQYHFLVGFNALTQSESVLFQEIVAQEQGQLLWDIDASFYSNPNHASGHFIRHYFQEWKVLRGTQPQGLGNQYSQAKKIKCIASENSISQVKYAAHLAQELTTLYPNEKIALVLGDESYLVPAISSFDATFTNWNVTMGYPLIHTPAADLVLQWVHFLEQLEEKRVRLETLEKLVQTAFLEPFLASKGIHVEAPIKEAKRKNQSYLSSAEVEDWFSSAAWQLLVTPFTSMQELINRMRSICIDMQQYFFKIHPNAHYESHFYSLEMVVNQLSESISFSEELNSLSLVKLFMRDLLQNETQDIEGQAYDGLQIMGLLETRLLDFDRVVITHLNEGILPAGKTANSFLPFEVKKEFHIPTYQEKDAIFTYHFYRLLQRSKEVYLLYDAAQEGLGGSATSRFVYQLEYFKEAKHQFEKQQLQSNFTSHTFELTKVTKSPTLQSRLEEIAKEGFSPSALTLYLRDPIAFYKERILRIKPVEEADGTVSYRDQGTIVHNVLEELYAPYLNAILSEKEFKEMESKLGHNLKHHFKEVYGLKPPFQGKNHLIYEVLFTHCQRFIHYEKSLVQKGGSLQILALEDPFDIALDIPDIAIPVRLRGTVDRIDRLNGELRIIDYKTGNVEASKLLVDSDQLDFEGSKKAIAFQVLTYAYQYLKQNPTESLQAGVYALKSKNSYLNLQWKGGRTSNLSMDTLDSFERYLFGLVKEIITPVIPFQQKEGN